ncbi:MAG: hypothetical protein HYZ16_08580 [Bacteroidetes bacterium]|nr:hypothetical protein [Bacteroidota bacterium]
MKPTLIAILVALIGLGACDPGENEPEPEKGKAALLVKAIFEDGTPAQGAQVDLYKSAVDFQGLTNSTTTIEADNLGEALFNDLDLQQYWFRVELEEYSNATSTNSTGRALVKDETLEKITQLRR